MIRTRSAELYAEAIRRMPGGVSSPVRAFAAVFMLVFIIIFLGSMLLTFLLPETYRASARVVAPGAASLERFQSAEVLSIMFSA